MSSKTLEKTIDVGIVYNAFEPTNVERSQLVWRKNATLNTYLSDLPTECDWKIGLNGFPIDLEKDGKKRLKKSDKLILVVVPHGGGGSNTGKTILRTVAMIGLAVAAAALLPGVGATFLGGTMTAGLHAGLIAAVTIGGSMLINALIPPVSDKADSTNYGYDGAKNTAKPGVAIPVVYGTYRVAGNYVDNFTKLVGQDQYLYGRTVLCDGQATGVGTPLINDQPISNYSYLEIGYGHGYNDYILYDGISANPATDVNFASPSFTGINPYFDQNITQVQVAEKIPGSASNPQWLTYTTTAEVDQFILDLEFPRGLIAYGDTGIKHDYTANLDVQYCPHGTNNWQNLGGSQLVKQPGVISGATPLTDKLAVTVQPNLSGDGFSVPYAYDIQYKLTSDSTWKTFKSVSSTSTSRAYTLNNGAYIDWSTLNPIDTVSYIQQIDTTSYEWAVPAGEYNIRITGQGTMMDWSYRTHQGSQLTYSWTNKTAQAFREQISSGTIDRGIYDIRYRNTMDDGDNVYVVNELYIVDVAEITTTPVGLTGVTYGWYAVKMTDQLSGIPNVTFQVQGVAVNKYDVHGNVTATEYSNNPAWIVLDMLIGDERGSPGIYQIDYPGFVDWAEWCESKSLFFNGVFDATSTLWDACQVVLKVGHANFTRVGTKISVVIDKPVQPVMLFGPGNIFKDSFKVDYIAIDGRANEFEVSYFDETDYNKQKTLRIVDPTPINAGDLPRAATYSLQGVTNFDQAYNEAWYQLYNNRYIRRTVTFDAPVESIGLSIGDVALIQHDMMNWGVSGRIAMGSNTGTAILDKEVTFDDQDWSMLVIFDNLPMGSGNITAVGGFTVTVENCTNVNITEDDVQRLYVPSTGADVQIIDISYSGTTAYVVVENTTGLTNAPCQFVATDAIQERDIVKTSGQSTNVINLATPFDATPQQYSNYMVGIKTIVKKPYRLKTISGTGFDARTLTFVEYNENIFLPPGNLLDQPPTAAVVTTIGQVTDLRLSYDNRSTDANTSILAYASWSAPSIGIYGGADIYVSTNGGSYIFYQSVLNSTSFSFYVNQGDTIAVKVVAYSATGSRASLSAAPYASITVQSGGAYLVPPSNLETTLISFLALGLVQATWLAGDATPDLKYRVQVLNANTSAWDEYAVTSELNVRVGDLAAGNHQLRVRSEKGTAYSIWSTTTFAVGTTSDTIQPGATVGAPSGTPFGNTTVDNFLNDYEEFKNNGGTGDTSPPSIPTGLTLISNTNVVNGNTIITVTAYWNQNVDDNFSYYDIEFSENGGGYVSFNTSSNTYNITVNPNDAINAKLRAISKNGIPSGYTAVVSLTAPKDNTPPAPVTNVTTNASYSTIYLAWSNPSDSDLKDCVIRVNSINDETTSSAVATVNASPSGKSGFSHSGLISGTTYYYFIYARDTSGNLSTAATTSATAGYAVSSEIIGQLTAAQIASVNATQIAGTITSTQISDGAISTPKLAAGSVTGATIAAGTIQAGNLAAGSVVASKISVVTEGLFPDPLLNDPAWWDTGLNSNLGYPQNGYRNPPNAWYIDTIDGVARTGAPTYWVCWDGNYTGTADAQVVCPAIVATPSTTYEISAGVWNGSSQQMVMVVQSYDTSNNYQYDLWYQYIGGTNPNTQLKAQFTTTSSTKSIRVYWQSVQNGAAFTGIMFVGNVNIRQAASATLLVDGTITSAKIATGAIVADNIAAGTITGDKISSSTTLPASLSIGNTGYTLGTINSSIIGNSSNYVSYNGDFAAWANGNLTPDGYVNWIAAGSAYSWQKIIGYNGSNAAYITCGGGSEAGMQQTGDGATPPASWQLYNDATVVLEAEIVLNAGSLRSAGILLRASGGADKTLSFYYDPDGSGNAQGDGIPGLTYKFSKVIKMSAGSNRQEMFLMNQWGGMGTGDTSTGANITWIKAGWRMASSSEINPAGQINANTTLISPGKIQLQGATTLTNWLYGGDNTLINGGAVAANTVTANKLAVGLRGIVFNGLDFTTDRVNTCSWGVGDVNWYDESGNLQVLGINGGSFYYPNYGGARVYIWWNKGQTNLNVGTTWFNNPDDVLIAVYYGGTNLNVTYGRTVIDGDFIKTGSITANNIAAGSISADRLAVGSLAAISAIIGTLRTATSGARMEISDNVIKVFDSNNTLRVQLGDLSI